MFTQHRLTAVAAINFFIQLINAVPTAPSLSLYPSPVLYSWSTDPICKTTATKTDCATAYKALCARPDLSVSDNTTMGDCTAFYWYDAGNTLPTAAECTAAYSQILSTSIGGVLGYNAAKNRTSEPVYAIFPKDGNANCFKVAGDNTPILALDELPDGGTLQTCPVSSSRRRRALAALEGRSEGISADASVTSCNIQDAVWSSSCTAVCLGTVVTTSWLTGPFAVAGWIGCLGGCAFTGFKIFNNCQKANGYTDADSLISLNPWGGKRELLEGSHNPCVNIKQWTFQCPGQETGLLKQYGCQQTIEA